MEEQIKITEYDISKQLLKNERKLKNFELEDKARAMSKKIEPNSYWLLLCREKNDYFFFNFKKDFSDKKFCKDIKECLTRCGVPLRIDESETNSNAYEIWIRDSETEENFLYFFFRADDLVIKNGADYKNTYWLLLCKERNDYTLFNFGIDYDDNIFIADIIDCLSSRGSVLNVDNFKLDENASEISVLDTQTEETFLYHFFNINDLIIENGGDYGDCN